MPKPVCCACERFYRPKKNGTAFVEMMPRGSSRPASGIFERDQWQPYKLWMGDLWHCEGCGHELIVGAGANPISERHHSDFSEQIASFNAKIVVNDC